MGQPGGECAWGSGFSERPPPDSLTLCASLLPSKDNLGLKTLALPFASLDLTPQRLLPSSPRASG